MAWACPVDARSGFSKWTDGGGLARALTKVNFNTNPRGEDSTYAEALDKLTVPKHITLLEQLQAEMATPCPLHPRTTNRRGPVRHGVDPGRTREGATMNYIGIDPGKSGAIAVHSDGQFLPAVMKLSETPHDVAAFLREHNEFHCTAIIERVASSPQMGVRSSFTFGESYGFLQGLLTSMQIPFERITPVKWQNAMKCRSKGDKNVTKKRAQELYPSMKITHATADAILLARFCMDQAIGEVAA